MGVTPGEYVAHSRDTCTCGHDHTAPHLPMLRPENGLSDLCPAQSSAKTLPMPGAARQTRDQHGIERSIGRRRPTAARRVAASPRGHSDPCQLPGDTLAATVTPVPARCPGRCPGRRGRATAQPAPAAASPVCPETARRDRPARVRPDRSAAGCRGRDQAAPSAQCAAPPPPRPGSTCLVSRLPGSDTSARPPEIAPRCEITRDVTHRVAGGSTTASGSPPSIGPTASVPVGGESAGREP